MTLLQTVEAEIAKVKGTVDNDLHNVLAQHLGFSNVVAHIAQDAAALAANPIFAAAEAAAGLPASMQLVIANDIKATAAEVQKLVNGNGAALVPAADGPVGVDAEPDAPAA